MCRALFFLSRCVAFVLLFLVMDDMQRSRLMHLVERMPAFPQSVTRVIDLSRNIDCQPKEIVRVIEHDPVMTMKLLKLVNSAFYGLPRQITSINHTVITLGINTVKNMALSIATIGMIQKRTMAHFDTDQFLLHSLVTADLARSLALRIDPASRDATDHFVAGLLHDFGKIVLMQFETARFAMALSRAHAENIPLHVAEALVFGFDHADVGAMLSEQWQLPTQFVLTIGSHHRATDHSLMADVHFAANQLSKYWSLGNSGNPVVDPLPAAVLQRFSLPIPDLAASIGNPELFAVKAHTIMRLYS